MTDYYELAELADQLLGIADEDNEKLSEILQELEPPVREELIDSDFLNAYQVFYYYFRTEPEEIEKDRLMLEPATSVKNGIHINDFDILEIYFSHNKNIPEIIISDGDNELKRFSGKNAYIDAMLYLKEGFDY
ncbi:hypothetical protein L1994_05325 [Methanomicrobium antiquum]|uniref:Uncharacterized protein n=1 Tax=Methanomicrobium antiquum TaxID=487686 RepID=A0AAF0FQN4_9EURY|nr:hypothetical protein [Methanomicrobium antiquum]MDD3976985.1 hypothetical protein [Methanomicrobium sp.]WFN37807.1 hypothetical protein L1994_05325 [Methanomicrobium antiquum]